MQSKTKTAAKAAFPVSSNNSCKVNSLYHGAVEKSFVDQTHTDVKIDRAI